MCTTALQRETSRRAAAVDLEEVAPGYVAEQAKLRLLRHAADRAPPDARLVIQLWVQDSQAILRCASRSGARGCHAALRAQELADLMVAHHARATAHQALGEMRVRIEMLAIGAGILDPLRPHPAAPYEGPQLVAAGCARHVREDVVHPLALADADVGNSVGGACGVNQNGHGRAASRRA